MAILPTSQALMLTNLGENLLVVLPTNSGKTRIAAELPESQWPMVHYTLFNRMETFDIAPAKKCKFICMPAAESSKPLLFLFGRLRIFMALENGFDPHFLCQDRLLLDTVAK